MFPAMAAGVTDRLWEVNDLVALWEARAAEGGKSGVNEASSGDRKRDWSIRYLCSEFNGST